MKWRYSVLGCVIAAGIAATPMFAAAQAVAAQSFIVTTIAGTGTGTTVVHEGLSIDRSAGGVRLNLASADGSMLSVPATTGSSGEIESNANAQDAAVTCYNMAMRVLAQADRHAGAPTPVFVRFGNSVVQIPLDVRATQTHGSVRTISLAGQSAGVFSSGDAAVDAGIVINATVQRSGENLSGAMFDEIHYLQQPANVIARSTCILQSATPHAATRT